MLCEGFHVQMFNRTIKLPIKKQNKAQFFHQVNSSTPSPIFLEGDCQAKFIPSSSINCKISTKLYELYNLKYTPTIRKQWWFTNRFKEGYWQRRLPLWPKSPWQWSRFRLKKIFDKQLHLGYPHSIYWPNHMFCQFVLLISLKVSSPLVSCHAANPITLEVMFVDNLVSDINDNQDHPIPTISFVRF